MIQVERPGVGHIANYVDSRSPVTLLSPPLYPTEIRLRSWQSRNILNIFVPCSTWGKLFRPHYIAK